MRLTLPTLYSSTGIVRAIGQEELVRNIMLGGGGNVSLRSDNVNNIKSHRTLIRRCKEVGLEINAEQTRCMLMSRHQIGEQNRNIKPVKETFEIW